MSTDGFLLSGGVLGVPGGGGGCPGCVAGGGFGVRSGLAQRMGPGVWDGTLADHLGVWLAAILDGLGGWWNELRLGQQVLFGDPRRRGSVLSPQGFTVGAPLVSIQ
jgi:hypothetical protein